MTVHEAIDSIRRVGSIQAENGKLKIRLPEPDRAQLEPAIDVLRRNRPAAMDVISGAAPPAECWPESLRELADERAAASGNLAAARKEVWISWCEWKARELNRLFLEQGATGQPGRITADTVRDGERKRLRGLK
jgi:hypothetical protein